MRVKGGPATKNRRKKWLNQAEGSFGTRHISYRIARQTVIRAGQYAFAGRRAKKTQFRELWIARINSAVRALGYTYSKFMAKLHEKKIDINRKMLAELAFNDLPAFNALVKQVMA